MAAEQTFHCREWLFEKVESCMQRRRETQDQRVKGGIIIGGPGTGKTAVLSEFVWPRGNPEGLQHKLAKKVVAYHFCQAHRLDSLSVASFVQSVAEQLGKSLSSLGFDKKLEDPAVKAYLERERCLRNPDESFKDGVLMALHSLPSPEDVYLVIVDSVHESYLHSYDSVNGSRTIAELLAKHSELFPPWLYLLVSARKQSKTVTKMFTGFRKITLDDLRKSSVVTDIQQYILNRLDEPLLRKQLTKETAEIFNQLHIKSNGCFLYLKRILDGVVNETFKLEDVRDTPGTLNGLYLWLCQRFFPDDSFEVVRPILHVVLATPSPLTEEGVFHAVWTRNTDLTFEQFQERINQLYACGILIKSAESVIVFHHSFSEWLIGVKYCTPKYLCSPGEGHAMLAMCYTLRADSLTQDEVGELAMHLSRIKLEPSLEHHHLALWLMWSGAKLPGKNAIGGPSNQKAVELLHDAGVDINLSSAINQSTPKTEENKSDLSSVQMLLDKGVSVDQVDESGRTPLCHASYSGNANTVRLLIKNGADVNFVDKNGQSPITLASRQGHNDVVYLLVNCGTRVNHADSDGCTALRAASWRGHSDVVNLLLKHGGDVNCTDNDNRTALRAAAWGGHSDIVAKLLLKCANPNQFDKDGRTALIAASYMGHAEVVKILLDYGADVNHADSDGRTALSVTVLCTSVSENHVKVGKLLLQRGATVDHADYDGMTPLCVACHEGHTAIVELLLDAGADTMHWDRNGRTPIFAAASNGHEEIVKMILQKTAAKSRTGRLSKSVMTTLFRADNFGWTPFLVSAYQGHQGVVKALLQNKVNLSESDKEGKTALMLAAQEGQEGVTDMLLKAGAQVDQAAKDGRTALFFAALENRESIVKLLVESGANTNHTDSLGRTPVYACAVEGNKSMLLYLLKSNASVEITDHEGRSPLLAASWQGHHDVVEILVENGSKVNSGDNNNRTALMAAAWQGHTSVVQHLIEKGADIDAVSNEGASALCVAAQEGHDDIVQLLLENGAKMNIADKFDRTPMQVAAEAGHNKVMKLLEAFSVMRMNESHFTCSLQRKLNQVQFTSSPDVSRKAKENSTSPKCNSPARKISLPEHYEQGVVEGTTLSSSSNTPSLSSISSPQEEALPSSPDPEEAPREQLNSHRYHGSFVYENASQQWEKTAINDFHVVPLAADRGGEDSFVPQVYGTRLPTMGEPPPYNGSNHRSDSDPPPYEENPSSQNMGTMTNNLSKRNVDHYNIHDFETDPSVLRQAFERASEETAV